jgi:hypothetical protein
MGRKNNTKGLKLLLSQRNTSKLGLTELGRKNNTKRVKTFIRSKKNFQIPTLQNWEERITQKGLNFYNIKRIIRSSITEKNTKGTKVEWKKQKTQIHAE